MQIGQFGSFGKCVNGLWVHSELAILFPGRLALVNLVTGRSTPSKGLGGGGISVFGILFFLVRLAFALG